MPGTRIPTANAESGIPKSVTPKLKPNVKPIAASLISVLSYRNYNSNSRPTNIKNYT